MPVRGLARVFVHRDDGRGAHSCRGVCSRSRGGGGVRVRGLELVLEESLKEQSVKFGDIEVIFFHFYNLSCSCFLFQPTAVFSASHQI